MIPPLTPQKHRGDRLTEITYTRRRYSSIPGTINSLRWVVTLWSSVLWNTLS